jgi:hypothetical protein
MSKHTAYTPWWVVVIDEKGREVHVKSMGSSHGENKVTLAGGKGGEITMIEVKVEMKNESEGKQDTHLMDPSLLVPISLSSILGPMLAAPVPGVAPVPISFALVKRPCE